MRAWTAHSGPDGEGGNEMADKQIDPKLPGKDEPAAGARKTETRETAKKNRNLAKKTGNIR